MLALLERLEKKIVAESYLSEAPAWANKTEKDSLDDEAQYAVDPLKYLIAKGEKSEIIRRAYEELSSGKYKKVSDWRKSASEEDLKHIRALLYKKGDRRSANFFRM